MHLPIDIYHSLTLKIKVILSLTNSRAMKNAICNEFLHIEHRLLRKEISFCMDEFKTSPVKPGSIEKRYAGKKDGRRKRTIPKLA